MTHDLIDIATGIANRFTNQPSTITGTIALWDRDGIRLALVKLIIRYVRYCDLYSLEMSSADLLDFVASNEDFAECYGTRAQQLYTGMIIGIAAHLNMFELMPSHQPQNQTHATLNTNNANGAIPDFLKGVSIFDLLSIKPINYVESLLTSLPCMADSYAFFASIISGKFTSEVFQGLKGCSQLFGWSEYVHSLAQKALHLPRINQTPQGIRIDHETLLAYYTSRNKSFK